MHEAELSSSEDDTLDDLYDEDDVDGEAELDDDHGDNLLSMGPGEVPDDATTDGDDVYVHAFLNHLKCYNKTTAPQSPRKRSLSPAQRRKKALGLSLDAPPRSYTIEAICAIPHPVPTHALASSACMTHLLTGSDDGYIRDYDIFAAVNSKNFLTAPQRHHAGVVEGLMKSGQLRFWWENPTFHDTNRPGLLSVEEEPGLAPVYSLAMQSDALWALAGTIIAQAGYINLFTLRHEPGRLCHVMNTHHRSPISALCLDYDEKGFFSAGWDGVAIQWDLNTGQNVRNFTAHHAQLTGVSLRPMGSYYTPPAGPIYNASQLTQQSAIQTQTESSGHGHRTDARSDASFDPLFDDVPEDMMQTPAPTESKLAMPGSSNVQQPPMPREPVASTIPPPKGAPPLIDPVGYQSYSSDILMTTFIDGQVILWDRRVQNNGRGVGRLWMNEKTPPWCLSACWSADGAQIYAGRRNGTVDVWDVRVLGQSVAESVEDSKTKSGVQFKIVPGHHGGYISQMLVDPGARFLVSASSNRGLHGDSTRTVFVHDIKHIY
ncbi:WD40-repeat-containing domain protein [Pholiota molesta]|nr:WD40-repeat-containing domain protein [Pholiota molesta]